MPESNVAPEELLVVKAGRRSVGRLLAPLRDLLVLEVASLEAPGGEKIALPRITFNGPNSGDPIRIGIFAAIHGDEPVAAVALVQFLLDLARHPAFAENYRIDAYPVCNPTGFEDNTRHSRRGRDLNREFWKASASPEVRILESELRTRHFHGLIQLHADDTSDGIYGFVRGATLTEHLLRPALLEAGRILPRNVNAMIDGFAARDGIIYDAYEGILAAPSEVSPVPFEIVFETPHAAPVALQVRALDAALRTILTEYRQLISFAQNL